MKEMILLGAGASIEAGVPGAYKMTTKMLELFEKDRHSGKSTEVLRFVIGGLLFQLGIEGKNPFDGVNVEDLFNAVQLLAKRNELEASPFIGSWHQRVNDLDSFEISQWEIKRLKDEFVTSITNDISKRFDSFRYDGFDRSIDEVINNKFRGRSGFPSHRPSEQLKKLLVTAFKDVERLSSRDHSLTSNIVSLFKQVKEAGKGDIFRATAQLMTDKLVEMVWVEDQNKVAYLNPLVEYVNAKQLTVATLNYDNTIELSAQSQKFDLETGIKEWSESGYFPEKANGIYLLKLHGSIDWALKQENLSSEKPYLQQTIEQIELPRTNPRESYQPALLFGESNKLTAKGPFLDLLRTFGNSLMGCSLLTIIGYSFRDDHINEFIGQWMNNNSQNQLRIINGESFSNNPAPFIQKMLPRANGRINMTTLRAKEGIELFYKNQQ